MCQSTVLCIVYDTEEYERSMCTLHTLLEASFVEVNLSNITWKQRYVDLFSHNL